MKNVRALFFGLIVSVFAVPLVHAAYPGDCAVGLYQVFSTLTGGGTVSGATGFTISSTGSVTLTGIGAITKEGAKYMSVKLFFFENGSWKQSGGFSYTNIAAGFTIPPNFRQIANINSTAAELGTACPAQPCPKGPGAPIYTGLPYDAAYYEQAGICDNGCVSKPASGPILNSYAQDGSGYLIGPWESTGEQCETGITAELPPQPQPEDQDDAGENACAAKCAGQAYQYDSATGSCECFGAPSYTTDPPQDPTVPTTDPGSPNVPAAQNPATDPGGDPQLGAQIANQGKQINQGDAQLGQLGAINNKLGAVISNQGKQFGQGDKIIDYQRRQLGALEDIRNNLAEEKNADIPGLPDQPELDGSIPDTKNWTEYDDAEAIGQAQGQKQIDIIENLESDSPFTFGLNTSGADPCLSGPLLGTQIDICFNRPWMLTGYAIMNGITISVGYLQAFLMIQKVITGA